MAVLAGAILGLRKDRGPPAILELLRPWVWPWRPRRPDVDSCWSAAWVSKLFSVPRSTGICALSTGITAAEHLTKCIIFLGSFDLHHGVEHFATVLYMRVLGLQPLKLQYCSVEHDATHDANCLSSPAPARRHTRGSNSGS